MRGDALLRSAVLDELRHNRILIADIIPGNLALLHAVLKKSGFRDIVLAHNGADLMLELRRGLEPGQPVVDIILIGDGVVDPDARGLCEALRSEDRYAGTPVLLLSTNPSWDEAIARTAYEAGVADVLFKPTRTADLLPRVIAPLRIRREQDQRRQREQSLSVELADLKALRARLQYLVVHDDLTGLANRRGLEEALELAVQRARRDLIQSALLYLDIDQFKVVNSYEGHRAGDALLLRVGNLLRESVREGDTLARISSDEYALLLNGVARQQALDRAEQLRAIVEAARFESAGHGYRVSASVGVALLGPHDTTSASEILSQADQACYVAKNQGRNLVHLYSRDDTELLHLHDNMRWVPLIRDALAHDNFDLVFQPVLRVGDRTVQRYEALLRMIGPDDKLIDPLEFIGAAERMGLIHHIDRWVIGRAIETLGGLPPDRVDVCLNVNLSGHAFQDAQLVPIIREHLRASDVAAQRITFEITETAAIANFTQTRRMVDQLRALGCRFALDDFGAGFNSYNYLKQLPVDYLKIDGAFIINLTRDTVDQTLVKSMVAIARTLGKETVAEFVGNAETLALLQSYGVDYAQGHFVGPPQRDLTRVLPPVTEHQLHNSACDLREN